MLDDHELTEITDEQFREESGAARALLTSTFSAWTEAHEQTRTEEPELLLIAVTASNKGEEGGTFVVPAANFNITPDLLAEVGRTLLEIGRRERLDS